MINSFVVSHVVRAALSVSAFVLLSALYGCSSQAPAAENTPARPLSEDLALTPLQLQNMEIRLDSARVRQIESVVYVYGKVVPMPNSQAVVSADIEGKVDRIMVQEGSRVKKGQELMSLRSMALIELQNQYMAAFTEKEFQAKEYERQKELRRNNVGALADYQTVEARYMAAVATEKALRAKLEIIGVDAKAIANPQTTTVSPYLVIRAPIDGFVFKLPVTIGMMASPESVLAELINTDEMMSEFFVYEKDIHLVREGQEVELNFVNQALPSVKGKVAYISRALDQERQSISVHARFTVPAGQLILPDMNVKAEIMDKGQDSEQTLAVPLSAVLKEEDQSYVFLTMGTGTQDSVLAFRKVKVELGDRNDTHTEVKFMNGLPTGPFLIAQNNVMILESERKRQLYGEAAM